MLNILIYSTYKYAAPIAEVLMIATLAKHERV